MPLEFGDFNSWDSVSIFSLSGSLFSRFCLANSHLYCNVLRWPLCAICPHFSVSSLNARIIHDSLWYFSCVVWCWHVGGQSEALRPWQRSWGRRLDIRKGGIEPQESPWKSSSIYPHNHSLPTLLLCAPTYTSDFTGGCSPPPLSEKELT